jgi:uncharacterized protein (TIGR02996 family)
MNENIRTIPASELQPGMDLVEIDGSDTFWLIYADFLDDNDRDGTDIREQITTTFPTMWSHEYRFGVGVGIGGVGVGIGGGGVGVY